MRLRRVLFGAVALALVGGGLLAVAGRGAAPPAQHRSVASGLLADDAVCVAVPDDPTPPAVFARAPVQVNGTIALTFDVKNGKIVIDKDGTDQNVFGNSDNYRITPEFTGNTLIGYKILFKTTDNYCDPIVTGDNGDVIGFTKLDVPDGFKYAYRVKPHSHICLRWSKQSK
jgi:hypothetical protein